jgi:hypothetical protein
MENTSFEYVINDLDYLIGHSSKAIAPEIWYCIVESSFFSYLFKYYSYRKLLQIKVTDLNEINILRHVLCVSTISRS